MLASLPLQFLIRQTQFLVLQRQLLLGLPPGLDLGPQVNLRHDRLRKALHDGEVLAGPIPWLGVHYAK